jgi:C-terminal processing protease CtpA/Prc
MRALRLAEHCGVTPDSQEELCPGQAHVLQSFFSADRIYCRRGEWMRLRLVSVLATLCLSSTGIYAGDEVSESAKAYIDAALKVMHEHSLYKDKIDWIQLRMQTLAQAGKAETSVDTYPAIRFALAKLGDNHSYLLLTPELTRQEVSRKPRLVDPSTMPAARAQKPTFPFPSPFRTRRVPEGAMVFNSAYPLAHIVIPLFASQERKEIDNYATKVQNVIAELALENPCGWIVDLRGNSGGNMWAMMAGVGVILGEGEPGAVLHEDGRKSKWFYENGRAGLRNDARDPYYARTTHGPVRLSVMPPVAVLIDRDTGSSGEGIAIAFRGRPDTRFFGEATYGAATSTFPYKLSDGAQLFLVTGVMLDRNGKEYSDGVTPDQVILSATTIATNDPVIRAASEWLSGLRACQAGGK